MSAKRIATSRRSPAEPDAAGVRLLDRGNGAAGDELGELEALVDLHDHGVDALGEVADLVAAVDVGDAGREVALADLGRRLTDPEDRPADAEGEDQRADRRRDQPDRDPDAEAPDHLPDGEIGIGLALLDQHGPGNRAGHGEGAERQLAVGPRVGLDRDHRRAGRDPAQRILRDGAAGEVDRSALAEHLPTVRVDDVDGAGLLERMAGDGLAAAGRGRPGPRRPRAGWRPAPRAAA